ncbi:hypothetical protein ACFFS4_36580 [Kutzneria kofuensis]|uniref:Phosphatidylglycerophosphate synthase n=1 Tax=Kutzneria kofuensis TaxID=103725 RepID=A0A7W9NK74_9PSEU|nr:hypothetical protein [Kutzneria kofuensis]MBB5895419.1 phosphatidylglycerophosphate synthase [Kutzneria kofuensis]
MKNDRDRPGEDNRLSSRLTFVAMLAAALILPPLLTAASRAGELLGLPAVWVYLFATWAAVIAAVGVIVHRSE